MFTRAVFSARHKIHNTHHWRHRDLLMRNVRTAHPAGSAADRTRIQHTHSQAVIFPGNKSLHDKTFARYLTSAAASVKIKIDEKYDEGNRTTIQKHDKYLELHHNGQEFTIPYIWLKDNCRCPNCIHANSKQKNIHRKLTLGTVTSNIELNEAGTLLKIQWDDGHETGYDVNWLVDNAYTTRSKVKIPPMLWDGAKIQSEPLPTVDYESYMNTESGLRETLYNLLNYGVTAVEGVPATAQDTQEAVERMNFLYETMYGKVWVMNFNSERDDIGYTKMEIGAHTDLTFYTQPAGIQALHCLHHEGTGGENWLVDGFQVAEKLRHDDPEAFDNLTKQIVPHEYIEKGFNLRSLGRILTVHPASKEMLMLRFNPSDLAPLDTVPPDEVEQFYADYNKLTKLIRDPANCFRVKLNPGMLLFVNNWRLLHGRDSFTGDRVLVGCYISHDEFMSKARLADLV